LATLHTASASPPDTLLPNENGYTARVVRLSVKQYGGRVHVYPRKCDRIAAANRERVGPRGQIWLEPQTA